MNTGRFTVKNCTDIYILCVYIYIYMYQCVYIHTLYTLYIYSASRVNQIMKWEA